MNVGKTRHALVREFTIWKSVSGTVDRHDGGAGLRNLRRADFLRKNLAIVFVAQSMTTNNDQILLPMDQ